MTATHRHVKKADSARGTILGQDELAAPWWEQEVWQGAPENWPLYREETLAFFQ